jgi:hypothetical protein
MLSAHEGGVAGIPDPKVLAIAADSARILLSHDRKTMPSQFTRFRETPLSPGVIIVSQNLDINAAIEDLTGHGVDDYPRVVAERFPIYVRFPNGPHGTDPAIRILHIPWPVTPLHGVTCRGQRWS